jgi:hypothetical protein
VIHCCVRGSRLAGRAAAAVVQVYRPGRFGLRGFPMRRVPANFCYPSHLKKSHCMYRHGVGRDTTIAQADQHRRRTPFYKPPASGGVFLLGGELLVSARPTFPVHFVFLRTHHTAPVHTDGAPASHFSPFLMAATRTTTAFPLEQPTVDTRTRHSIHAPCHFAAQYFRPQ